MGKPPVDALYQCIVVPVATKSEIVGESKEQKLCGEAVGAVGLSVTVIVLVSVAFEHPPVPVTVYVIVDVPAATGVISPVEELIVATPVEPDVQEPASPFDVKVVEPFEQTACVPLNVPAFGAVVTVTVLVAVAFEHPLVPVTV